MYDLAELPEELIVVGSGVTGAEFASAYQALGSQVTLVSSRERVLPHEDKDAAVVIEGVFRRRGMNVLGKSRAEAVHRKGDGVVVTLADGRQVSGSHCLLTVGMAPSTTGIGLPEAGVHLDSRGFIEVDRVSRTSAVGVYAAGDCTGVLMLASVAAMQGRIAMWHALGEAVQPIRLSHVASTIFTDPEIASVGVSQAAVDRGEVPARVVKLPLATNPRAKMGGIRDGFVKIFARPGTGLVLGGVVVAPRASELILPLSIAIEQNLSVDQIAHTFSVYPSLVRLRHRGGPHGHGIRHRHDRLPRRTPRPRAPRPNVLAQPGLNRAVPWAMTNSRVSKGAGDANSVGTAVLGAQDVTGGAVDENVRSLRRVLAGQHRVLLRGPYVPVRGECLPVTVKSPLLPNGCG